MPLNRLHQFVQFKNLSLNQFEKSLEVSHGSISNAIKNNKSIGSRVIQKILDTYPELSAEWFFRGEGPMILPSFHSETEDKGIQAQKLTSVPGVEQDLIRHLEIAVLSAWEKKYGHELKIIKQQLMTLFTAKLDNEKAINEEVGSRSKTG